MSKFKNREEATRHLMTHDLEWTHLVLPLQKLDGTLGYAVSPAGPDGVRVYLGNIFAIKTTDPHEEYPDLDAAMRAGWRVD